MFPLANQSHPPIAILAKPRWSTTVWLPLWSGLCCSQYPQPHPCLTKHPWYLGQWCCLVLPGTYWSTHGSNCGSLPQASTSKGLFLECTHPTPFLGLIHCLNRSSSLIFSRMLLWVYAMCSLTECSLPQMYQDGSNYHFTVRFFFLGQRLSRGHSIPHSGTLWAVIKWLLKMFSILVDKDIFL